jgi:hypothetical protein
VRPRHGGSLEVPIEYLVQNARRRWFRVGLACLGAGVFVVATVWAVAYVGAGSRRSAGEGGSAGVQTTDSAGLSKRDRVAEADGDRITLHDADDRFTVAYPPDWVVSDRPINTWVSSPHEILAIATYPLRPGGDAVVDFQLPSHAVEDLGPDDMLIWVSESGDPRGFADRPARFEPSEPCGGDDWTRLCPEPTGDTIRLNVPGIHAWWIGFKDQGRGFYAFVGMGGEAFADPARAQQAWDVLDSLRFLPR